MAIRYTLKKKEQEEDERTVAADEFAERVLSMKVRETKKLKEIPNTEKKK